MNVKDLITPDSIVDGIHAFNKKQLLQEVSNHAANLTGLDAHCILERLIQREKLSSTGFGEGVAIPHVRSEKLDRTYGFFFRLRRPVDFDAIDDQAVDLVFLLLTPEGAGADHLQAFSRVSRMLGDKALCDKIRGCNSEDAVYAVLTEEIPERFAA